MRELIDHSRTHRKRFASALVGDYLESGRSTASRRRSSLLSCHRESSSRTSYTESRSAVLFLFVFDSSLTSHAISFRELSDARLRSDNDDVKS